MKRIIMKFATLLVLLTAGFFFQETSPINAAASCWETAMNKWMACDNAYSNTLNQYANRTPYCDNNSANNCSATANNYCASQASTTCANDPDYQTCYNNTYNNCYLANYQSCHTQTNQDCLDNVDTAYTNRGNSYSSCLGFEGNGSNCIEQLDDCDQARDRASACDSLYIGEDNLDAFNTCMNNSGIWQCQ